MIIQKKNSNPVKDELMLELIVRHLDLEHGTATVVLESSHKLPSNSKIVFSVNKAIVGKFYSDGSRVQKFKLEDLPKNATVLKVDIICKHEIIACAKANLKHTPPKPEPTPEKKECPVNVNVNVNPSQNVNAGGASCGCGTDKAEKKDCCCLCSGYKFYSDYRTEALISATGLKTLLETPRPPGAPRVVVIDVQNGPIDDPDKAYLERHIPGAIFMNWRKDLSNQSEPRYFNIPTLEAYQATLSALGIKQTDHLIFYDNGIPGDGIGISRLAVRGYFVTEYYNHPGKVQVLNGGLNAWVNAGYPVEKTPNTLPPTDYKIPAANTEWLVQLSYVVNHLNDPCEIIVDARPYLMWTGQIPGRLVQSGEEVARRGHIQGAINAPWPDYLNPDGTFKSSKELYEYFVAKDIIRLDCSKKLILTCNEGIHAVFAWFALTQILFYNNVVVYEGSAAEYADNPLLPMVSGFPIR